MEHIVEYLENLGVNVLNFPDLLTFLIFILCVLGLFNLIRR